MNNKLYYKKSQKITDKKKTTSLSDTKSAKN